MTAQTNLTSKGVATRERIVAAAAELMFVRGVAGTTLEQVREAAQVSSSQIYHYFADKDALVHAVVDVPERRGRRLAGRPPGVAELRR